MVWCILTVAIKAPGKLGDNLGRFAISLIVFVVLSEGLPTLKGLGTIGRVLFAFTIGLAALGVHQGMSQKVCFQPGSGPVYDATKDFSDGRMCDTRQDCYDGGDPNVAVYACEHPGLFSTHSIGGRVRYRGILEDPNELSWALSMGLPLAFALYELRRTRMRLLGLIVGILLAGICTVMTAVALRAARDAGDAGHLLRTALPRARPARGGAARPSAAPVRRAVRRGRRLHRPRNA